MNFGFSKKIFLSSKNDFTVEYLIVAGGGGGGGAVTIVGVAGGGGGAGGYRTNINRNSLKITPNTTYGVLVGAGGAGGEGNQDGSNGNISSFAGIESAGGGGGLRALFGTAGQAKNGGCGGGSSNSSVGLGNIPPTIPSQGNNGGYGVYASSPFINGQSNPRTASGGGGGAAQSGFPGPNGAQGGNGITNRISGNGIGYAGGGGGGGGWSNQGYETSNGAGGFGGGGNGGGGVNEVPATSGEINKGGGGGGGARTPNTTRVPGSGGSGIVIIRYIGSPRAIGGDIDTTSLPGYTIHTFTSSGNFITL